MHRRHIKRKSEYAQSKQESAHLLANAAVDVPAKASGKPPRQPVRLSEIDSDAKRTIPPGPDLVMSLVLLPVIVPFPSFYLMAINFWNDSSCSCQDTRSSFVLKLQMKNKWLPHDKDENNATALPTQWII